MAHLGRSAPLYLSALLKNRLALRAGVNDEAKVHSQRPKKKITALFLISPVSLSAAPITELPLYVFIFSEKQTAGLNVVGG